MEYIEKMGTGIKRMQLMLEDAHLPKLEYHFSNLYVEAVFSRPVDEAESDTPQHTSSTPPVTAPATAPVSVPDTHQAPIKHPSSAHQVPPKQNPSTTQVPPKHASSTTAATPPADPQYASSTPSVTAPAHLQQTPSTPPVQDDMVWRAIIDYCSIPRSREEIQKLIGLSDKKNFLKRVMRPMLEKGLLSLTIPDKPNSPKQKYIAGGTATTTLPSSQG
jgi:ATP-dependent DNA helicase RecG